MPSLTTMTMMGNRPNGPDDPDDHDEVIYWKKLINIVIKVI